MESNVGPVKLGFGSLFHGDREQESLNLLHVSEDGHVCVGHRGLDSDVGFGGSHLLDFFEAGLVLQDVICNSFIAEGNN